MADDDEPENTPVDDQTPDAASPRQQRKRLARKREAEVEGDEFWRAVLNSVVGRREMWALLNSLGGFEVRFECGPTGFPQPEATWFRLGEHTTAMRLYHSWLRLDLAAVQLMHQEHDPRFAKPKAR
jgi:hypothetical protein